MNTGPCIGGHLCGKVESHPGPEFLTWDLKPVPMLHSGYRWDNDTQTWRFDATIQKASYK